MSAATEATLGIPAPAHVLGRRRVEGRLDQIACDYVDDLTLALDSAPTKQTITTLTCGLANQEALVA